MSLIMIEKSNFLINVFANVKIEQPTRNLISTIDERIFIKSKQ